MKTVRQLSIAILVMVCAINLYAGARMIMDPSGRSLGLPFYMLNGTAFKDYTIPGWILLTCFGLLSLFTIIVTLKKLPWYSNAIVIQGLVIVAIVIAQMIMLGDDYFLQYFFLMTGFFLVALGFLQNQMKKNNTQNHHQPPQQNHHSHRHH
jgi:hypothetical protein